MQTTPQQPKRRLAILTHEYYPVLCGGTVFAEKMAIEWSALGYDVEILTCRIGKSFPPEETVGPFRVRRFWTGRKSIHDAKLIELLTFFALGLPQILVYLARHPKDLLFSIFAIPSGLIGNLASRLLRVPHFTFVDAADTPGIQSAQQGLMRFMRPVFRWATTHATGVIILQGIEEIARPQISNPRLTIIPNGTSIPDEIAQPGSKNARVEFLSIGRIVLRKGFKEILEALAEVAKRRQDFHLTIIGYGTREDEIREILKSYQLESFVTLVGRVEYAQLKSYYLQSDCYLFYGAPEGSSLAMIEALSYGLPMIVSDDPGTRAYVIQGENGALVEHLQPKKLAAAIETLLENRTQIPFYGKRSREIAVQYSWTNIARKYDQFFGEKTHL
ncbi:glycosyltransferase family 4 protein [Bdellovibrionota bacterium FG-1]